MSNLCDFFNCGNSVSLPNAASNEIWVPVKQRKSAQFANSRVSLTFNHGSVHSSYKNCVPTYYNTSTKDLYYIEFAVRPQSSADKMDMDPALVKYNVNTNTITGIRGFGRVYVLTSRSMSYFDFAVLPCKKSNGTYTMVAAFCASYATYLISSITYYTSLHGASSEGRNNQILSDSIAHPVYLRYSNTLETFVGDINGTYYKWDVDNVRWVSATSTDFNNASPLTGKPAYGNGSTINFYDTQIPNNASLTFQNVTKLDSFGCANNFATIFGPYAIRPIIPVGEYVTNSLYDRYGSMKVIYCEDFIGYTYFFGALTYNSAYECDGAYAFLDANF